MSDKKGFAKFFGSSSTPVETRSEEEPESKGEEITEDYEGQLAIDAYETETSVIVKAPIAGVKPEDLDISITDDVVTIKGERKRSEEIKEEDYLCQECYWGSFSRSYILPVAVDADKAKAAIKDGVLTVTIPKEEKSKTRIVPIAEE